VKRRTYSRFSARFTLPSATNAQSSPRPRSTQADNCAVMGVNVEARHAAQAQALGQSSANGGLHVRDT